MVFFYNNHSYSIWIGSTLVEASLIFLWGFYYFVFELQTRYGLLRGMDRLRESLAPPQPLAICPTCGEPAGGEGECQFCRQFGAFAV